MSKNEKPLPNLGKIGQTINHRDLDLDEVLAQLNNLLNFFSLFKQEQELKQKQQVLTHIAHFIQDQVNSSENTLEISKNAACFLCKEEDIRLRTEDTPCPKTLKVIDAAKEIIIAIKVDYERLSSYESCLRQTEIFFLKADKPTVKRVKEEINWESLTSDIRHAFLRDGKNKISFRVYPPQK